MEMTLNLTYEEGAKVIHALKDVALKQGWSEEDIVDAGILEEFSEVVDAALEAMGIKVSIDASPAEEEEEDEDMESIIYDVDGRRGISARDAKLLVACVAKVFRSNYDFLPDKVLASLIQNEVLRISDAWGIEMVDMSEDE